MQKKSTHQRAHERRQAVVVALRGAEAGLSIDALAARFECSARTIYRDLAALESQYLVQSEQSQRGTRWRAVSGPRNAEADALIPLFFAHLIMRAFRGTGLHRELEDAYKRRRSIAPETARDLINKLEERVLFLDHGTYRLGDREQDFEHVLLAVGQQQVLQLRHCAVSGGTQLFKIEPYALLIYKFGFFIVGHSEFHKGVRTFGFDGLSHVERLARTRFSRPKDFNVEKFVEGPFGLIRGAANEVEIRFDRSVARYARRRHWHPSQRFEVDDRGDLRMKLVVEGTEELESWLLSFGRRAEVVTPDALARQVRAEARGIDALYAERFAHDHS